MDSNFEWYVVYSRTGKTKDGFPAGEVLCRGALEEAREIAKLNEINECDRVIKKYIFAPNPITDSMVMKIQHTNELLKHKRLEDATNRSQKEFSCRKGHHFDSDEVTHFLDDRPLCPECDSQYNLNIIFNDLLLKKRLDGKK